MPNFSQALKLSEIIKSDQIDEEMQCEIDLATSNIMRLAFSEVFILFVTQFGKAGFYYVLYYRVLGKQRWKPVLYLSDFTLWLLYNQGIHWVILLFSPFFIVISPLINISAFFLFYYVTKNFYSKSAT